MGLIAHCLLDMLIVFGFLTAICVIGGVLLYVYAVCQEKVESRHNLRLLAEITAREDARIRAEAQLLGQFASQLQEIRALPIANPWDVA